MDEHALDILESHRFLIGEFNRIVCGYRDAAWRKEFATQEDLGKLRRNVGRRIAQLRRERGLTAVELSSRVELTPRQLTRIEGGHQLPSTDTLARIAKALTVDVKELWELPKGDLTRPRRGRPRKC
jgi:ribosome-binding protein aMBF1 (putative translation factor)